MNRILACFVLAAFLFAGCVVQQTTPTATPTATVAATSTPLATSTPTPTVEPSPTEQAGGQTISKLKDEVKIVLKDVFSKEFVFTEDKNPVNGLVSYFAAGESNYFNVRVSIEPASFIQWPPTKTLVEKQGESGSRAKTIVFTQSSSQQPQVQTEMEMECNGFQQLIVISLKEQNTASLPFQNLAGNLTAKLIDACP